MKKAISVILALAFLLIFIVGNAVAEDFSIHSGVTFGMTMDEVKAAEKANGFSCSSKKLTCMSYSSDGSFTETKVSGLIIEGTIASIPDSQIYYYFDSSGQLFEAMYIFKGGRFFYESSQDDWYCDKGDTDALNIDITNQYNTIEEHIEKKYSDSGTECTWEMYPKSMDAIDENTNIVERNAYKIRLNDNEWLYITHRLSQMKHNKHEDWEMRVATGHHYLDYRLITEEELSTQKRIIEEKEEKERKENEEKEKEKQQQLANDL